MLFTRDLRLHDNPALHLACARARQVAPLFVVDPAIAAPPNRLRFLRESLLDLRDALQERGATLLIRNGDPAAEAIKLAAGTNADAIYLADDVSRYATRRRLNLERDCRTHRLDLKVTPGLTVVPPGDLPRRAAATTGSSPRTGGPGARRPGVSTARPPNASPAPASGTKASSPHRSTVPHPAWPKAASRPADGASPVGASASWPATTSTTTTWPAMRPPGSARTCGSAASPRWNWRSAPGTGRAARNSAGSSPGVTSSTR